MFDYGYNLYFSENLKFHVKTLFIQRRRGVIEVKFLKCFCYYTHLFSGNATKGWNKFPGSL